MNTKEIERYIQTLLPEFVGDYKHFMGNPLDTKQKVVLTSLIEGLAEVAREENPVYSVLPFDEEDLREFIEKLKIRHWVSSFVENKKGTFKEWLVCKIFGLKTKSSTRKKILFLSLLAISTFLDGKIEYGP